MCSICSVHNIENSLTFETCEKKFYRRREHGFEHYEIVKLEDTHLQRLEVVTHHP
jgi:hypothetical protein